MADTQLKSLFRDSIPLTLKDSGVYGIINRTDGRLYIGSSSNLSNRRAGHKCDFSRRDHSSDELQRDVILNPENFEFVIIESIPNASRKSLQEREDFWIGFYRSYNPNFGYNKLRNAYSAKDIFFSKEYRDHMSKIKTGFKMPPRSEQWIKRQRESHLGKKNPSCHKAIVQIDLNGIEVARFESITAASKSLGEKDRVGGIVHNLTKPSERKTAFGFVWRYA